MLGRRLLGLLVAMLCIVARLGMEAGGASSEEVQAALAGPGVVCRTSDADAKPDGSADPDGLPDSLRAAVASARAVPCGPWQASQGAAPSPQRRGDPRLSRGPPSLVVS